MTEYRYQPQSMNELKNLLKKLPYSEWKYIDTSIVTNMPDMSVRCMSLEDLLQYRTYMDSM